MTATLHVADAVVPICAEPVVDGAVLVEGDRVVDVGPADAMTAANPAARVRRWTGALTPGLVNAHAHLQYTSFVHLATSGLPFAEWISRMIAERAEFTDEGWVASTRAGVHQALATGTTSVADIVTDPVVLPTTSRSGLGGISYVETWGADQRTWQDRSRARMLDALTGAPRGRALGVSPHTLYTLDTRVFGDITALGRERGLRVHTHLAESAAETEYVLSGTGPFADSMRSLGLELDLIGQGAGCTPTVLKERLGVLGPDVHVAHAVHCDAGDRAILRQHGTSVALCPRSNAILSSGEAPVAAYLAEGNPVAVGTDSLASSPSLDLWADVAALRALAVRQGYDGDDLDRRLVEAATVGGAAAMGLDDVGLLRPGARADLAVFDVPADDDPYRALVAHGEGRCVATVLAGRIVHRR